MTIFTFEIWLETLEVFTAEFDYDDYDEKCLEYAEFQESCDGSSIYAESIVSAEEVRRLVHEKCIELSNLYTKAALIISRQERKIDE